MLIFYYLKTVTTIALTVLLQLRHVLKAFGGWLLSKLQLHLKNKLNNFLIQCVILTIAQFNQ